MNPDALMQWATAQNVPRGEMRSLALPPEIPSADGQAVVTTTEDGRRCVLVRTAIGYKDNFDGIFVIDAPLRAGEVIEDPSRPYLSLPIGQLFEELYIRRRIDERAFEVFFDLN